MNSQLTDKQAALINAALTKMGELPYAMAIPLDMLPDDKDISIDFDGAVNSIIFDAMLMTDAHLN